MKLLGKRDIRDVATTPTTHANSDDDDDADTIRGQKQKRRRIIVDSDSDQENECDNKPPPAFNDTSKEIVNKAKASVSAASKAETSESQADNSRDNGAFEKKLKAMSMKTAGNDIKVDDEDKASALDDEPQQWLHTKLDFMQPNAIKDGNGRRRDHPEYDPTTLYVPKAYLESLSPVWRQPIECYIGS